MSTIVPRIVSVLLLAALATFPGVASAADADSPAATIRLLQKNLGKAFQSAGGSVDFEKAKDGRFKITIGQTYVFLVADDPTNGPPLAKFSSGGSVKIEATVEGGSSGLVFGIPRWKKHFYVLFDRAGNADLVMTTEKPDGLRLDAYAKVLDMSSIASIQAGAGMQVLGRGKGAEVEAIVGVPLTELSTLLNRPGGARPAARPAIAAARPVARPGAASSRPAMIAAPTGPRIALVIGNAAYAGNLGSLANPLNDARAVSRALRAVGFTVIEVGNADQRAMKRAIQGFGDQLSRAGRNATGLFYYAGHGVQSRGVNYLVPLGAAIQSEADVDIEAVSADAVVRQMEDAGVSTNIVILDACRNLPVQRLTRDGTRGLARMDAPNGSFVAYSTAPGSVAQDGSGANSPFATALIAEIAKPDQLIESAFRNIRRSVVAATGGKQTPWDSSSLTDSFVFNVAK